MTITVQQAEKLLRGNQSFTQLGFSLLLTRLKKRYISNPSRETLQSCVKEIDAYLEKFQRIMAADYAIIEKLK